METAPLKSFATWARTALIRDVIARVAVVLAPASPERVEQPKAVDALEKAVNAAGGGEKGRTAVADRVAYTWFNRIIALRFMDANGYTGTGVVSPPAGVEGGQPEILAEAKRGNIDVAIVATRTREAATGLLYGTRRSKDPQGEAYALLLADYCRHWNRAMPFMFEREGDFTELLIPANLLADDSVLNRAVKVLTADVCKDVEVIGWLYQFYISERKAEVFAGFKRNKKADAAEIPAATQLFTPHWIVRYLVENSLGRLWILNRPTSRLADQMEYYIAPVDQETDFLKISTPEELKVIDPACGSGHMLTYAFDLLYAIYEEEGYAPSEISGLILANNLYGTEIDPRAGALAAFALTMKARARQRAFLSKGVQPNILVIEPVSFTPQELDILLTRGGDRHAEAEFWNSFQKADILGSLIKPREDLLDSLTRQLDATSPSGSDIITDEIHERVERLLAQAEYLAQRYHVIVTNPPYMGSKNMGPVLGGWLTENYPRARADLMTAFMERAESLGLDGARWGMINLPSWLFLASFEELRRALLASSTFESLLHLGRGVFGSDFGSVAFVVTRKRPSPTHQGVYRRLFEAHVEVRLVEVIRQLFLNPEYGFYRVSQSTFLEIPGAPFAYWADEPTRSAFRKYPSLGVAAVPLQGLATADDGRFLRRWWEVSFDRLKIGARSRAEAKSSKCRWFPFTKGGEYRRWYGNNEYVVNWENDGEELYDFRPRSVIRNPHGYFQESLTWGLITSGESSFRYSPAGYVFGHKGPAILAKNKTELLAIAAFVNSTSASHFLRILSPTIGYEVGHIAKLPLPPAELLGGEIASELVEISKTDWDSSELSWDFSTLPSLKSLSHEVSACALMDGGFDTGLRRVRRVLQLEAVNNERIASALGLDLSADAEGEEGISLLTNPMYRSPADATPEAVHSRFARAWAQDLVSYAVGCMFGRYSLDEPGLILVNQGATMQDYLARVPTPTFIPDADSVIPIVDGDWFDDDIMTRFRKFLRTAFGEQHFEENLRFVTESLGVKELRDYFLKSFYEDHWKRYKKRPIYWLFSSPKGSFNALIYMHRYMPSTVSTVLNEYLREYRAKLESSLQNHERLAVGGDIPRRQAVAQKEADRLRKVLLELDEYERDVLYPLASQQVSIDLDDGVKVNYSKFGAALKRIPGLEASDE
jgi:hypothetical protein